MNEKMNTSRTGTGCREDKKNSDLELIVRFLIAQKAVMDYAGLN